jgi:hypothetical protein
MPTKIEKEKQDVILDTFRAGIHALGLADKDNIGAAKGDIKLTAKGPMIGEIAARLSGGYMSGWTYPYSSGALPIKAAILAAMGREPAGLTPTQNWTCAERAFISIPGTVKQITNDNVQTHKVNDFFMRIKEGDKVSFPENNVSKCGNIIASAPDAIAAAETAARSVLIRLDPADKQTAEFLAMDNNQSQRYMEEENKFPPDAFNLTGELISALEQIPETETQGITGFFITPFPAFTSSNLTDYMGRTVEEALVAVRTLTGFALPIAPENAENVVRLGRSFWAALIRGSYQGAVWYIDNLGARWTKQNSDYS